MLSDSHVGPTCLHHPHRSHQLHQEYIKCLPSLSSRADRLCDSLSDRLSDRPVVSTNCIDRIKVYQEHIKCISTLSFHYDRLSDSCVAPIDRINVYQKYIKCLSSLSSHTDRLLDRLSDSCAGPTCLHVWPRIDRVTIRSTSSASRPSPPLLTGCLTDCVTSET